MVTTAEEIAINQNVSHSIDFADLFTQPDKFSPPLEKAVVNNKEKM